MASRLGRRVVQLANLPLKLIFPAATGSNSGKGIREFALRTIPSATKFEIKSVLQALYGFQVEEVRTLNMEGKKKKRGGVLLAQPDYKKAYVTLRHPLPYPRALFPLPQLEEERNRKQQEKKRKTGSAVVLDSSAGTTRRHWLDDSAGEEEEEVGRDRWDRVRRGKTSRNRRRSGQEGDGDDGAGVFPYGKTPALSR